MQVIRFGKMILPGIEKACRNKLTCQFSGLCLEKGTSICHLNVERFVWEEETLTASHTPVPYHKITPLICDLMTWNLLMRLIFSHSLFHTVILHPFLFKLKQFNIENSFGWQDLVYLDTNVLIS